MLEYCGNLYLFWPSGVPRIPVQLCKFIDCHSWNLSAQEVQRTIQHIARGPVVIQSTSGSCYSLVLQQVPALVLTLLNSYYNAVTPREQIKCDRHGRGLCLAQVYLFQGKITWGVYPTRIFIFFRKPGRVSNVLQFDLDLLLILNFPVIA